MATIKDVARLAGVSTSTVSRALNGRIPVDDETKEKVMNAVVRFQTSVIQYFLQWQGAWRMWPENMDILLYYVIQMKIWQLSWNMSTSSEKGGWMD